MPPLRCPACKNIALKTHTDQTTQLEIDACPKCWGIWFDAHELATFLKSGELKARFMFSDAEPLSSVGFVINTTRRKCPRDSAIMEEKIFAGITLDTCPTCRGIWFDDGEVRQIVEKYKQGSRTGDTAVVSELKTGLGDKRDGLHMGVFASLLEFIKGARA